MGCYPCPSMGVGALWHHMFGAGPHKHGDLVQHVGRG
jgi:hypothetical protein